MITPKSKFTAHMIEEINAYGPYNHGHWDGKGVKITNEEGLEGRGDFLVKKIIDIITRQFSYRQISRMSICDIGCYDGWILHQLSLRLPFRQMLGIEPRRKNIIKGKKVRQLLGIKTRAKFLHGGVEDLGKRKFDIVLCLGVLHHLESIPTMLRQLDAICRKLLVLDTIVLPSKYITQEFKNDIEMKDIIYQFKEMACGITGHKYESSYYDGSTVDTTVVGVPSIASLKMYLDVLGYDPVRITASPQGFMEAMKKNKRPFQEVLIYGVKAPRKAARKVITKYVKRYEEGLIKALLPEKLAFELYSYYCRRDTGMVLSRSAREIVDYIDGRKETVPTLGKNFFLNEIIKNLRFNSEDKLRLEWGKVLYVKRRHEESVKALLEIVRHLNADWRSAYRSFYLLSKAYAKLGYQTKSDYYFRLCKTANPNFPLGN